jgi:hypothetical protein
MRTYILLLWSFCSLSLLANTKDTTIVKSEINKVTVFFAGAQINRQATFKSLNGQQLLLIDGLPLEIEKESLKIGDIPKSKTISVKLEKGSSRDPKFNEEKEKTDIEKKKIEKRIKQNRTEKEVYNTEENFIISNQNLAGDNGVSIEQIREGADYYRSKLMEIRNKKLELEYKMIEMKEKLLELDKQKQKLNTEQRKESTKLYLLIDSKEANPNAKFEISYYLKTAAWEPVYDFRVKEAGEPLIIDYKALIYQTTGEDWEKVDLTLSTGDPSLSSEKPILDKWYVDKRKATTANSSNMGEKNALLKGKLYNEETREPVPFANIVLQQEGTQIAGTSSDFDGNYTLKPLPPGVFDFKATSVGYMPTVLSEVHINKGKITFLDVPMYASDIMLDEFAVVENNALSIHKDKTQNDATISAEEIYKTPNRNSSSLATTVGGVYSYDYGTVRGSRAEEKERYIEGSRIIGSASRPVNQGILNTNYLIDDTKKNMSDIEYKIKETFTVLSDGKDYALKIREATVPVDYLYFAIPKLDNDVFLTARIAGWNQLNLLSGKSSIYYQGTFIGEGYIEDEQTSDTLDLSLGRDRDIVVTRKGNKERIERKVLGKNIKETLSWDIEIKNNKNEEIKLVLEDQFPLAENKDIEIELIEISAAEADEKTGKLSWELEMDAGEKKSIQLTYSIKYPNYIHLYSY